jgi:hypothetical protein
MVTPGLLDACRCAARLHPRSIVSTVGFHFGHELQYLAVGKGYTQQVEDRLLDSIGWPKDGYRLFEIAVFAASATAGWFQPISESNALFMSSKLWAELGGYNETFESAGGGLVNLDTYARAVALPKIRLVTVLGEGTFHQVHGALATNSAVDRQSEWHAEYRRIRGHDYRKPMVQPILFGCVPAPALPHLESSVRSLRQALDLPTS